MKRIMKCKPVYNFQSVEFDFELDYDKDKYDDSIEEMFDLYEDIVEHLKEVAPEQPKVQSVAPKSTKKNYNEEPATLGQKNYLRANGIPFGDDITKDEAFKLIKSMKDGK